MLQIDMVTSNLSMYITARYPTVLEELSKSKFQIKLYIQVSTV